MFVNVRVINLSDGSINNERPNVNIAGKGSREWLDKTILWAIHNGCGVQVWNANDKEPA